MLALVPMTGKTIVLFEPYRIFGEVIYIFITRSVFDWANPMQVSIVQVCLNWQIRGEYAAITPALAP